MKTIINGYEKLERRSNAIFNSKTVKVVDYYMLSGTDWLFCGTYYISAKVPDAELLQHVWNQRDYGESVEAFR